MLREISRGLEKHLRTPQKPQEVPEGSQKPSGGSKKPKEASGGFSEASEARGAPRSFSESPGSQGPQRLQEAEGAAKEALGKPWRLQEVHKVAGTPEGHDAT